MPQDTDIGGPGGRFPTTHGSAIVGVGSSDTGERQRSFDTLVAAYWKPVYKYIRIRWNKSNEDAKDLTQSFFLQVLEKDYFRPYDPARARFRTFLRTCLEGFLSNQQRAGRRLKRGGGTRLLSLDFERAEGEMAEAKLPSPENLEEYFEREWLRSLVGLAVSRLEQDCRRRGREDWFTLFARYDLDDDRPVDLTYKELAGELGMKVSDVTNRLAWVRREFRATLLQSLRDLTGSEAEFRREARLLLGRRPA